MYDYDSCWMKNQKLDQMLKSSQKTVIYPFNTNLNTKTAHNCILGVCVKISMFLVVWSMSIGFIGRVAHTSRSQNTPL